MSPSVIRAIRAPAASAPVATAPTAATRHTTNPAPCQSHGRCELVTSDSPGAALDMLILRTLPQGNDTRWTAPCRDFWKRGDENGRAMGETRKRRKLARIFREIGSSSARWERELTAGGRHSCVFSQSAQNG